MKPVKQTDTSKETGNCLSACVASILELDIDDVPLFVNDPNMYWFDKMGTWLWKNHDLFAVMVFNKDDSFHLPELRIRNTNAWSHPLYCIISGDSPHGDVKHAVVGSFFRGEVFIEFDPMSGSKKGEINNKLKNALKSVDDFIFFIPVKPHKNTRTEQQT